MGERQKVIASQVGHLYRPSDFGWHLLGQTNSQIHCLFWDVCILAQSKQKFEFVIKK